jgi:uncharacterized protein (TIGR02996 family)
VREDWSAVDDSLHGGKIARGRAAHAAARIRGVSASLPGLVWYTRGVDDTALLAAILAAPDDDAPRLVYADALQQRGDPWGELIALCIERDRRSRERVVTDATARELSARFSELYRTSCRLDERISYGIDRGFITEVYASQGFDVRALAGDRFVLLSRAQITDLTNNRLERVAAWPLLGQLTSLQLEADRDLQFGPLDIAGVFARASRVTTLQLDDIDLDGSAQLRALLDVPHARDLRELTIMAKKSLSGQLRDVRWPPLARLDLGANALDNADVDDLFATDALGGLRALAIGYNRIDDTGAAALARIPFTQLTSLELQHTDLGRAGVAALADAPALAGIERFMFGERGKDIDDALPSLGDAFPALTSLWIAASGTPRQLAAIARPLRRLQLELPDVDIATLATLLRHPALRSLRELRLAVGGGRLGEPLAALLATLDLPELDTLDVSSCKLGTAGARVLAGATQLPASLCVRSYSDDLGEGAEALRARFAQVSP